jgi:hypothetical protein
VLNSDDVISYVDNKICWECADTRPVFAHAICEKLDSIVKFLEDELA